ncbi:MAG TPA: hypothetical protein DEF43_12130 [Chloroflexus aurantiacus]|nr:MAG: hypothetical protein D6716_12980 [Chloroflexota bacterium]HBW67884.1 hypothetical protein [Chloroflexus aurantiacus]
MSRDPTIPLPPPLSVEMPNWHSRSACSEITFRRRYRYRAVMPVSRGTECGSHAAAPAVLTIRRGLQRTPVPARASDDRDG